MNSIIWYTVYGRIMVLNLYHMVGIMIEINIWKNWMPNHVVIKFGWMKLDICGDMTMTSSVIWIHQYQYYITGLHCIEYYCVICVWSSSFDWLSTLLLSTSTKRWLSISITYVSSVILYWLKMHHQPFLLKFHPTSENVTVYGVKFHQNQLEISHQNVNCWNRPPLYLQYKIWNLLNNLKNLNLKW